MSASKSFNWKNAAKFALKIIISSAALYYVFKKVDFKETLGLIGQSNLFYFIGAVVLFNITKVISTFRLKALLEAIPVSVTNKFNIVVYYIGAFYNLFLPGSISGDAYKVYLLANRYKGQTKLMGFSVVLDRLCGLAALLLIACVLAIMADIQTGLWWDKWLLAVLALLVFPVYYGVFRLFFPRFVPAFVKANAVSFVCQVLLTLCGWLLLLSLGVEAYQFEYLTLFLIASVVSVVPITFFGLGARELVFTTAISMGWVPLNEKTAVAFTLMVFGMTAVSSFIGLFFTFVNTEKL